ncbi:intermediate filament protein ifa-1-like [Homalodisca vitripennis]|uniref:intermediate filament protein ifa-1-like n=1 Tax=Homalodisca vitripennis TaxID=197043 RepID=UPI001EEB2D51|nr:intermediate filament protein ifa-1-like [Homalodisca vitripennis]
MFSQTVVLFFLCGFYEYCASAKSPVIEELERELNETKAAIYEVKRRNTCLEHLISDFELDFKRNVAELEVQNANVSEEVLKETAKIKELYINLTNLEETKLLLEREIAELQHWIEVRKLGIMFINQDIKLYRERIENDSAEKCFEFQEPVPMLLGRSDIDKYMVFMLQNELNQTRTTLNYLRSVQKELQMKLDQLTPYYKLKIDNLSELLERNIQDEEHAKETVKKFEMELKELFARISELTVEKNDLIKEQEKIKHDVVDLRIVLSNIKKEIACFEKLELMVLNTTPF